MSQAENAVPAVEENTATPVEATENENVAGDEPTTEEAPALNVEGGFTHDADSADTDAEEAAAESEE
ncbi:MAG: hypothetical protein WBI40_03655 [Methylococcaceae bacterium]